MSLYFLVGFLGSSNYKTIAEGSKQSELLSIGAG